MSRTHHSQKRRRFSAAALAKVWDRQGHLCACGCGEPLVVGHVDYDHEIPLWADGPDTLENLRALIRKHHLPKTKREATQRAKEARVRSKHDGTWLNAKDRELERIMQRTRLI